MSEEDVYATNNKIVTTSASAVAIVLLIMTIVFLVLLARRHRREASSRDERSESLPSIKGRSFSCVSDASSYGNSRGELTQRRVTIQNGLDSHIEVNNEEESERVGENGTDNFSPTIPTALSDSLSSAGQYHFSFRELEFADNCLDEIGIVNPAGPSEMVAESGNGSEGTQNNSRKVTEVCSSDSESCDDSEDDTTFETTVEA